MSTQPINNSYQPKYILFTERNGVINPLSKGDKNELGIDILSVIESKLRVNNNYSNGTKVDIKI